MFAHVATLFTFAVCASAVAVTRSDSQCNTGSTHCCNSVQQANSTPVATLTSLLGISLYGVTGQVGLNCSPLSIIGGGSSCTQQPVCCTDNHFSGLIVVGCTPININA